jgi:hypothetical protein
VPGIASTYAESWFGSMEIPCCPLSLESNDGMMKGQEAG